MFARMMTKAEKDTIMKDPQAVEEINKFKWIESEKAGCDIGFAEASRRWIESFGRTWLSAHTPKAKRR